MLQRFQGSNNRKARIPRALRCTAILIAALSISALSAQAQEVGPNAPPPTFTIKRIPSEPHPGPPPIPEQEIIQKFAANEDVMKKAYDTYNFTESVRLDELTEPGGSFKVSGEVYTRPNGERYMRVAKDPESTLKLLHFSLEDVRLISDLPDFPLTTEEIANYNFKYAGQEKLDQLNTYIFQVKPKVLNRKKLFFEGVIWIDDHDFAIVKSYGKFVSEIEWSGSELPFTMFETYRENFQGKYWLPTYMRSDDYFKSDQSNDLPLRLIVRSTDFKLNNASGGAAPGTTPNQAESVPASSNPATPQNPPATPPKQ
jgi:hypothetical protein